MHFAVVFEESAILPANGRNQNWKCWLWDVQVHEIYTTGHRKASLFQPWWSVRCAIPTFDVNQCSLRGSTFCFCLLRLGLAVTGAPGEHFGSRIHGVFYVRRWGKSDSKLKIKSEQQQEQQNHIDWFIDWLTDRSTIRRTKILIIRWIDQFLDRLIG